MSKLGVKKEVIAKFSINQVKDLEGCAGALRYLKAKFGDRVDDLTKCRADVAGVLDDHPDWAINFTLNLIKLKSRQEFLKKKLGELQPQLSSKALSMDVDEAIRLACTSTSAAKIAKAGDELRGHLKDLEALLLVNPQTEFEKDFIRAVLFVVDGDRKFTRDVTDALMTLAEAQCNLDVVKYKYEDVIKATATELMEFSDIWK